MKMKNIVGLWLFGVTNHNTTVGDQLAPGFCF